MISSLVAQVTPEDIHAILRGMKKNKCPGPDGFTVEFFLHSWDTVGDDFVKAVQSFFISGCMLRESNATAVALIPKVPNPTSMADFRPISCCNIIYKCISKILALRLKATLPGLISSSQAAFVPGRKIGNNILLAQELLRNYHCLSGPPRCALKIDLKKAFDSVRWEFLFDVLHLFGYPPLFVRWIQSCISTAMFSVKLNGSLCGYFQGQRGIRQGDPLSPYLFVLAMEVLAILLDKHAAESDFKFHWRAKSCKITHLCFADDLMLFCHGDLLSVKILKLCLDSFSKFSGLSINHGKSQCYLANIPQPQAGNILDLLNISQGELPVRFLGVPLITTKLTSNDCVPLIQKITQRIRSWANCFLSYAGRVQLIKSILFAIQSYWSAYFLLPKSITKQIDQLLSRFLWKGCSLDKYGAKVAWARVTLPLSEGGLGLKKAAEWNKAQILLHLWQVICFDSSSIWADWVRRTLLLKHNFWTAPIPSTASWIWRKVLNLRGFAIRFVEYRVGNGRMINLWQDPWLDNQPLAWQRTDQIVSNSGLHFSAKLSDIILQNSWNPPISNYYSLIQLKEKLRQGPQPSARSDQIFWDGNRNVNARIIWDSIRCSGSAVPWVKLVWHKLHVPRFSFFLWLAMHKRLVSWPLPICCLCDQSSESFSHLFFECQFSRLLLSSVMAIHGWSGSSASWDQVINLMSHAQMDHISARINALFLATIVYKIWNERNRRLHGETHSVATALAQECVKIIKCRLYSSKKFNMYVIKYPHLRIWQL